ncbi:helix-turn-helix domain-containing protein [Nocardia sp. NPDC060249]|uniref:helix-turn-helix domain-containing protein n=1 Tax=Nocardia sp. NPDC060249 TaxID=3347082 RepID=UPI00365185D4
MFGKYIQLMRTRHKVIQGKSGHRPMSREELAAALNISKSLVEKWELGERPPTPERLTAFFSELEVPYYFRRKIRQLVGYPDPPEVPAWPSELGELAQRHLDDFRGPAMIQAVPLHYVYAVNAACRELFPGLEPASADADRPASLLEWLFFHPGARVAYDVRDRFAQIRSLLCQLRLEAPGVVPPEEIEAVLAPLRVSPDFDTLWNSQLGDLSPYAAPIVRVRDRAGSLFRYSIKMSRDEYPPGPYVTYHMTRLDSSPLNVKQGVPGARPAQLGGGQTTGPRSRLLTLGQPAGDQGECLTGVMAAMVAR